MEQGLLLMTQAERDRLVALKKAKKKLITLAAEELGITERHVRRLLRELKRRATRWWRTDCGAALQPQDQCGH
jgi:predicted ArsR family transcriptional regulator